MWGWASGPADLVGPRTAGPSEDRLLVGLLAVLDVPAALCRARARGGVALGGRHDEGHRAEGVGPRSPMLLSLVGLLALEAQALGGYEGPEGRAQGPVEPGIRHFLSAQQFLVPFLRAEQKRSVIHRLYRDATHGLILHESLKPRCFYPSLFVLFIQFVHSIYSFQRLHPSLDNAEYPGPECGTIA
jgi:hypothetical protein